MIVRDRNPSRNQPFVLALVGVVLSILLVATVAALVFGVGAGLVLAPTATPTPTPASPREPTSDARATLIAEDVLTQVAYEAALPRSTPNPILLPIVSDLVAGGRGNAEGTNGLDGTNEGDGGDGGEQGVGGDGSEASGDGDGDGGPEVNGDRGQVVLVPVFANPSAPTPTPFSTATATFVAPTLPPTLRRRLRPRGWRSICRL